MSYQYPPPPPNGADMNVHNSGYLPAYSMSLQQPPPMGTTDPRGSPIRHMEHRDHDTFLKRSFSTPDARSQHQVIPEAQQQSPTEGDLAGERRRNKLGYHRTSVACGKLLFIVRCHGLVLKIPLQGHCRRRKIRCIPSGPDMQGRCVNCIRLKKDCSFYPVDQPPPNGTHGNLSRSSTGPQDGSSSSSPVASNTNPPFSSMVMHLPNMVSPAIGSTGTDPFALDTKGKSRPFPIECDLADEALQAALSSSATRPHDFTGETATSWIPTNVYNNQSSRPGDLSATWRTYPSESPIGAQFSPYSQAPPSSATWTSGSSESGSRDDTAWANYSAPVRSMSYSGEPLASHQQASYPAMSHARTVDQRSANLPNVYASPMGVSIPSMDNTPGTGLNPSASLSAGAIPPAGYGVWPHPQQQHQHHQYTYQKPEDGYPGWTYGEPGGKQPAFSSDPGLHFIKTE